ncbi:MAG: ABC transporter permease [Chloroflexota bacterium]
MRKILNIGWKDLIVTFRDRAALIMMLLAPFLLTLGMGLVTGGFSDDGQRGLSDIPVVVVNEDEGDIGEFLSEVLASPELAELLITTTVVSPADARQQVENDEVAAAVIIPAAFSDSIVPDPTTGQLEAAESIEIYANPARPISASVVEAIVGDFLNRMQTGIVAAEVSTQQLVVSGRIDFDEIQETATMLGEQLSQQAVARQGNGIEINSFTSEGEEEDGFNVLAFFAPGMAIFFLMYTVTVGARSIIEERQDGTFMRLLATPTTMTELLGGKVLGTFLTGLAQVAILIVATTILFGLRWGDGLGVALLIVSVALAATSWGILFASASQTVQQVNTLGTAVMLIFGVLGGTFFPAAQFSDTFRLLGRVTPHSWAMDGFLSLATGGTLADIGLPLVALMLMALVLFGFATVLLRRQSLKVA